MHNDWELYTDPDEKKIKKKISDLKNKDDIYNYYLSGGMKNLYTIVKKIVTHLGYPFTEMVIEDLEEIALSCLWKSVEKYSCDICDNFEPYFVENLKKKFFSYSTKLMGTTKRLKVNKNGERKYVQVLNCARVSFQNTISIDTVINENEERTITIGDTLSSDYNLELDILPNTTEEILSELKSGLSKTGKKVIDLIACGYDPNAICKMLNIKRETYNRVINNIREYPDTAQKFLTLLTKVNY